jgi:hypothetical protein
MAAPAVDLSVTLAHYDAACAALAAAVRTDEVQAIHLAAVAMRAYAKQAKNRQLEVDAALVRVRAERRLGELIAEQRRTVGLNSGSKGQLRGRSSGAAIRAAPEDTRPTLAAAGIDIHLAKRARRLAALSDQKFEAVLAETRAQITEPKPRPQKAARPFDLSTTLGAVLYAIRSAAAEWPADMDIRPLAKLLRAEADRVEAM